MSLWKVNKNRKVEIASKFMGAGINLSLEESAISENELTYAMNMCSDDYPIVRTRNGRYKLSLPDLTYPTASLGQRNSQYLLAMDGQYLKYATPGSSTWASVTFSSKLSSTKLLGIVEYTRQTDRYTVIASDQDGSTSLELYAWDGNAVVNLTTSAPKNRMVTSHKYRLFGIDSDFRTVKHSALSNIGDWVSSLDAGSFDITGAESPLTAITTFQGHVIVWSASSMHELYGTKPADYELIDVSRSIGCLGSKAFCECNNQLYWADKNGIYMYTGGIPKRISQKIEPLFSEKFSREPGADLSFIAMGAQGAKLYIAYPSGVGANRNTNLLVYDTEKQTWFQEDGEWVCFTNVDGVLYGHRYNNGIWIMNSTAETGYDFATSSNASISWSLISKGFKIDPPNEEGIIKSLYLEHQGTSNATVEVQLSTNAVSPSWSTVLSSYVNQTELTRTKLMLPYTQSKPGSIYKIKILGTGHKKIRGLHAHILRKGNRDG